VVASAGAAAASAAEVSRPIIVRMGLLRHETGVTMHRARRHFNRVRIDGSSPGGENGAGASAVKNLWNDDEIDPGADALALRCHTSRLLGRDKSLVLHGGGNTSVKLRRTNLLGDDEDILYVKGSGWDLATIREPPGSRRCASST
jgi:hypothetical protein